MIKATQLSYIYPGQDHAAVNNISFTVNRGEIFGFLGPSGAGKSTTQKVLIRLLRGYQGNVSIDTNELRSLTQDYYNHIGVGFELPNHYPRLTALENLKFFASFYRNKNSNLMQLLEMVGLHQEADKPTSAFSKGMKMRLNFVRALVHDPEILFFDEPTSGLDPINARKVKNIILDLRARGKTIFLTTHNMHDAAELCDRVAFITQGKISLTDSPRNLKLQHGTRKLTLEYGNGQTISREFALDKLGENPEFINLIKNEYIQSIHSAEASLEEVFIKTTGERLV
ncbi:MAG: ABC transporter ATP-binding protein [Bacteroidetes bacterium]|nr:MAG: ABC transporter ATP-binding protein [Bacteroidota bacterium]